MSPFLATMVHAEIVSNLRKRKGDILDTSRKALGGMIAKVVAEEPISTDVAKSRVTTSEILRT